MLYSATSKTVNMIVFNDKKENPNNLLLLAIQTWSIHISWFIAA